MAKDRRNKVRPKLDLESDLQGNLTGGTRTPSSTPRTTSNATRSKSNTRSASSSKYPDRSVRRTESARKAAAQTAPTRQRSNGTKRGKKRKLSRAALIVRCVLIVLLVVAVIFAGVAAVKGVEYFFPDLVSELIGEEEELVAPIDPTPYDTTPVENEGKVAYYLVGVLGEDEQSDTAMLSVLCHDKAKNTVSVMQLPQATYIDTADQWEVDTVGAVFANPKALDWCELCRKRLYEPEIEEGEKAVHIECGTEVTLKKGSSVSGLVDFVNDQLGLPVDDYFFLPQKAITVLVDAVGGVDVELSGYYQLAEQDYEPGVQTLSGAAATEYICYTDGTVDRDITLMLRQREVFGALLTRMFRLEEDVLAEDVIEEVMDSAYAIRTERTTEELCELVKILKKAGVEGITVQLLPGEVTSDADGDTVYSVHREELLTVLNASFNPYAAGLDTTNVTIPELTNSGAADVRKATLGEAVAEQTGKLLGSTDE